MIGSIVLGLVGLLLVAIAYFVMDTHEGVYCPGTTRKGHSDSHGN